MQMNNSGNSLIEIIIALAIFTWLASSLISLTLGNFSLMTGSGNRTKAEFLAQEGIEAVEAVKNRSWQELGKKQSALTLAGNAWTLNGEGSSEQIGDYTRTIFINDVYRDREGGISASNTPDAAIDPNSKEVVCLVSWTNERNARNEVRFATLMTNWGTADWVQNDWTGGEGQEIWQDAGRFFSQDGGIDFSEPGRISLLGSSTSALAASSSLESSAYYMGKRSEANTLSWVGVTDPFCPACRIEVRIKTAKDVNGAPGEWTQSWSGPDGDDGDEDDYFESNAANGIPADLKGKEWIKYKATLIGEASSTPALQSVTVSYQK